MKLVQRYFCYGSILTSLVWTLIIFAYMHLQDAPMQNGIYSPRENDVRRQHNTGVKVVPAKVITDLIHADNDDVSLLGIIRNPEDQKKRDEGTYDLISNKSDYQVLLYIKIITLVRANRVSFEFIANDEILFR